MHDLWLITEDVARALMQARARFVPTPDQQAQFAASMVEASAGTPPRNMTVAGDVAEIRIHGTLTKKPDIFAMWFGGGNTTYRDIIAGLALASSDPAIARVELNVDSPGGQVDGLFDAIASLNAFRKPISVVASCACSAAYGLAVNGGKIRAASKASNFGSIGTAISFYVDPNVVTLTNSDSPAKRPDVTTAAGKAMVVEYLDAVNDLFVEAISAGRGAKPAAVTKNYGRGAVLLAEDALSRGMIDSIITPGNGTARAASDDSDDSDEEARMDLATLKAKHPAVYAAAVAEIKETAAAQPDPAIENASAGTGGASQKETTMDLKTLKASHPDVYEAAVQDGIKQERDRVGAHLELGESSGAMDVAIAAVKAGDPMTQTITAKYLSAGIKRNGIAARQTESDGAGAAVDNAKPAAAAEGDAVDQGIDRFLAQRGKANEQA